MEALTSLLSLPSLLLEMGDLKDPTLSFIFATRFAFQNGFDCSSISFCNSLHHLLSFALAGVEIARWNSRRVQSVGLSVIKFYCCGFMVY